MSLKDSLIKYGLTEKEAQVYLATLELGQSTVNTIARKAGVFRTYCYDILKTLTEKGLVSNILKEGTKYYDVPNPESLLRDLKAKEETINSILPELNLLKATAINRPKTQLFEGREGVIAIHEDIIKTGKDTLVLGSSSEIIRVMGSAFNRYVQERIKNNIKAKVLIEVDPKNRTRIIGKSKKELRTVKEINIINGLNTTTYIYGNKVAILTYEKEVFGVIIESEAIATTQKILFEQLWNTA